MRARGLIRCLLDFWPGVLYFYRKVVWENRPLTGNQNMKQLCVWVCVCVLSARSLFKSLFQTVVLNVLCRDTCNSFLSHVADAHCLQIPLYISTSIIYDMKIYCWDVFLWDFCIWNIAGNNVWEWVFYSETCNFPCSFLFECVTLCFSALFISLVLLVLGN